MVTPITNMSQALKKKKFLVSIFSIVKQQAIEMFLKGFEA
jgi:hypothetical protein